VRSCQKQPAWGPYKRKLNAMTIPSTRQIQAELKRLFAIAEDDSDPILARLAYTVAEGIRWATENTAGLASPAEDIRHDAALLRNDIVDLIQKFLTES